MSTELESLYQPYINRWIAIVRGKVVGVGVDAGQAFRAAKAVRPKDGLTLFFVDSKGLLHLQPPNLERWFENAQLAALTAVVKQYNFEAYLVGGAVRDALLGQLDDSADLDLVVPSQALDVARTLADHLRAAYYPVDSERGVGRIVFTDHTHIDIAAFRGNTLDQDLRLRDFTLNAIALKLDPATPYIIDPLAGQDDLAQGLIRATNQQIFLDDPLRMVRAVRQAYQFGFSIAPGTEALIQQSAPTLTNVSMERLRDEVTKMLKVPQPSLALGELNRLGLLSIILPELPPTLLFDHALPTVDWLAQEFLTDEQLDFLQPIVSQLQSYLQAGLAGGLPRQTALCLAALVQDICISPTPGSTQEKAKVVLALLNRWRFSREVCQFAATIVQYQTTPLKLAQNAHTSPQAIYRLQRQLGDATPAVALLALAEQLTHPSSENQDVIWPAVAAITLQMCEHYFSPTPIPLLTGHEIINQLHLKPGPVVGFLLSALIEAQALGQVSTQNEAIAFVEQIYATIPDPKT